MGKRWIRASRKTFHQPTETDLFHWLKMIGSMYGICTYIYHKNQPFMEVNISYMDPMGNVFVLAIGLTDASKMFPVVGLAVRFHQTGFIVTSPLGLSNVCFPLFPAILWYWGVVWVAKGWFLFPSYFGKPTNPQNHRVVDVLYFEMPITNFNNILVNLWDQPPLVDLLGQIQVMYVSHDCKNLIDLVQRGLKGNSA